MASRQEKMERAEALAKIAAYDLSDVNREREYEERITTYKVETDQFLQQQQRENQPGVIGSMFKAVKDAVAGKSHDAAETARETRDATIDKTKEYSDYTTEKARETTNSAAQKLEEYGDSAAQKAKEVKDYAVDKAKQGTEATAENIGEVAGYAAGTAKEAKDSAVNKAREYKDYAAEKTKQGFNATADKAVETTKQGTEATAEKIGEVGGYAAGLAKGAKDSAVDKAGEYKDYAAEKTKQGTIATAERVGEAGGYAAGTVKGAKDATVERMGELSDYTAEKAKEGKDRTVNKLGELKDSAADTAKKVVDFLTGKTDAERVERMIDAEAEASSTRMMEERAEKGIAARENIYGAFPSITESIKAKLTQPSDVVEETRAARELGGTGRRGGREEVVSVEVKETQTEGVGSTLKAVYRAVVGERPKYDEGSVRLEMDQQRKVGK